MNTPKITIVTPSLNQAEYLEECMESVLNQGYPNLEYIVMDGGSTDGSVEIIRRHEPFLSYWKSAPDKGQSHAINAGFKMASGDIFAWLNSDDILMPGSLRHVSDLLMSSEKSWLVGGAEIIVESKNQKHLRLPSPLIDREHILRWHRNWFAQPSVFWKRRLWDEAGPLDEKLHFTMDLDLWLRMSEIETPLTSTRVFSGSRFHNASKTRRQRWPAAKETLHVWKQNARGKERFWMPVYSLELMLKCIWDMSSDRTGFFRSAGSARQARQRRQSCNVR